MRRKIRISIVTLMMLVSAGVSAQVHFGLKGGVGITEMKLNSDLLKADNRTGFFIGPVMRVKVIPAISLDLAALYNQQSYKVTTNYEGSYSEMESSSADGNISHSSSSFKTRSIDVPVNARVSFGLVYFSAGPQLSFNLGDKIDLTSNDWYRNTFRPKGSSFSINLGAGITFRHVEVGAYYNIACGNTGEISFNNVKDQVEESVKDVKSKTNCWRISAAVFF